MGKRTKAKDDQKQQMYLVVSEERSAGWSYGQHFYHLRARVGTQKYEQGAYQPWGAEDTYGDGYLYSGLRVSCQGDERSQQREGDSVYGFDVEYHDTGSVDLRKARRMIKTLELINRRLEKARETRGTIQSFGDYLGRIAEALGCSGMVFERTSEARQMSGYRWDWMSIGDGVDRADHLIYRWYREPIEKREAEEKAERERQQLLEAQLPEHDVITGEAAS